MDVTKPYKFIGFWLPIGPLLAPYWPLLASYWPLSAPYWSIDGPGPGTARIQAQVGRTRAPRPGPHCPDRRAEVGDHSGHPQAQRSIF